MGNEEQLQQEWRTNVISKLEMLDKDLKEARKEMTLIPQKVLAENRAEFVTKEEFAPIRTVVYGMVGFILVAFLSAIVALVLK